MKDGKDPACVSVCPTHCMMFGDLDDPNSAVSRELASQAASRADPGGGDGTEDLLSDVGRCQLPSGWPEFTMTDLVLTRHNELIDPLVRVWGWEIPVYLFLGGWVAGMMIIVGYFLLRGRHREETCVCSVLPGLSVIILSLGMLALFLDLEHKLYVWRLYTTFQVTSPMSWGAWILVARLSGAGRRLRPAPAGAVPRDLDRLRPPDRAGWGAAVRAR